MKLEKAKLKYSRYVDPSSIKEHVLKILGKARADRNDVLNLAEYVRKNIRTTRGFDRPPYPLEILKAGYGTCFAKAILLASMLRASGFNEDEVFVVVCKLHEFEQDPVLQGLLHAVVIVYISGKILVLNPSSTELCIEINSFEELSKLGKVYCIFNDKKGYICIPKDVISTF